MIRSWVVQRNIAFAACALLAAFSHFSYADDQTDINGLDFDRDDFSLDAPSSDEGHNNKTSSSEDKKSDSTGTDPLENFSTAGESNKLNLDENLEPPPPKNINETVGLDLNEPKQKISSPPSPLAPPSLAPTTAVQSQPLAPVEAEKINETPAIAKPVVESVLPPAAVAEVIPENDFFGTPYVPGGRKVMAQGEAPEYYKVEVGDTLFDICDQLVDEPGYWPKLWALNPGIKNPHFIFPGMTLSFYPGDDATPPYLQVIAEQEILPIETGGLKESELVAQPASSIADVGPAADNTFISDKAFDTGKEFSVADSEFETIGSIYEPNIARIDIPAFFLVDEVAELATVLAGPMGQVNVPEGQSVVVEIEDQALSLGSLYTVVRPSGEVYNSDGDSVGYRYEFVAHIKVIDKTDAADSVMAQVIKARSGVRPSDLVIAFRSTTRSFTRDAGGGVGGGEPGASVIGFEYSNQTIGNQGQLVYIDKQFSPGTVFPVYQRMDRRMPVLLKNSVPNVEAKIGVIKIIESSGTNSIGIVLKSELDIRLGDRLGRG